MPPSVAFSAQVHVDVGQRGAATTRRGQLLVHLITTDGIFQPEQIRARKRPVCLFRNKAVDRLHLVARAVWLDRFVGRVARLIHAFAPIGRRPAQFLDPLKVRCGNM